MHKPDNCSAQRSSRVWQVVGDIKRGYVQDQRRARCAIQCAMHPPAASSPAWKFMCSLCCAGVWRVRKRRIMRSSLRFSSPSAQRGRCKRRQ